MCEAGDSAHVGHCRRMFDFTVYSQLSTVLTAAFFPSGNEAAAQLSFWGVFAVGFVSRPLGSVLFGHIGDAYGRRLTMLLSILTITIPTVLIGCLPTYHQIGIAAPTLLAIMRFIQGLAVGGEFGSAIVYLYEIAPRHRKGLLASLGQQAIAPGIIMGILACLAVIYPCTKEQLELWGWRIPFLLTVFTTPIAVIMRMHMPEPYEYLQSAGKMKLQRVASTAAHKVAHTYSRQTSRQRSITGQGGTHHPGMSSRKLSKQLTSLTHVVASPADSLAEGEEYIFDDAAAAHTKDPNRISNDSAFAGGLTAPPTGTTTTVGAPQKIPSLRHCKTGSIKLAATGSMKLSDAPYQEHLELELEHTKDPELQALEQEYAAEVGVQAANIKHHVPMAVLFRSHWKALLLQFLMEAGLGASFYTWFSWVPAYIRTTGHVKTTTSLWVVLVAMFAFLITSPVAGWLSDKGARKMFAIMGVIATCTVVALPVLLALHTGHLAAAFLLLPLMMALTGLMGGFNTAISPLIYPAGVRASGFNIAHNLAMVAFGGCLPFMIQALSMALKPGALAAGVMLILLGVVSLVACVLLMRLVPATNARSSSCSSDSDKVYDSNDLKSSTPCNDNNAAAADGSRATRAVVSAAAADDAV